MYEPDLSELEAFAREESTPLYENGVLVGFVFPNGSISYLDDEEEDFTYGY